MKSKLLSAHEIAVWTALKRLGDGALAVVARELEAATRLSSGDFGVLSRLEDLGGGVLAQSELARSLGWQKSRLSHHLTRMEERRLLRRSSAEGARGVTIHILPAGRRAIAAARPIHAEAVRKHVLQLIEPREQDMLVRLAERWSNPLSSE